MSDLEVAERRLAKVRRFYRAAVRRCVGEPSAENHSLAVRFRCPQRQFELECWSLAPRPAETAAAGELEALGAVLPFRTPATACPDSA